MVLETTWLTPSGWLVVHDGLTIGPWHHDHADESSHTRPPTDHDADHMLVRVIECVQGSVQVEVVCEPMFAYGRDPAVWEVTGRGLERRRRAAARTLTIRLRSDMRLGIEGSRARARHTLVEGEQRFVALGWSHGLECATERRGRAPPDCGPPSTTGATGWPAAASRTIAGAATCTGRR